MLANHTAQCPRGIQHTLLTMTSNPRSTSTLFAACLLTLTACTGTVLKSEVTQTTSEAVSDPVEEISQAAPKPPIEQPVAQDSPNIVASTEPQSYLNSHGLESLGEACRAAIASVGDEVTAQGAFISFVMPADMIDDPTHSDAPRPDRLILYLDAADTVAEQYLVRSSSALALLEQSSQLILYTTTITESCDTVASVIFDVSRYQSTEIGLVDGQVTEFTCSVVSNGYGEDYLYWGQRYCYDEPDLIQPEVLSELDAVCQSAIAGVEASLQQMHNTYVDYKSVQQGPQSDTPQGIYLSLDAYNGVGIGDAYQYSAALNVMDSAELLTQYTEDILDGCGGIEEVRFALTEYQNRVFAQIDGQIIETTCTGGSVISTYCSEG